MTKGVKNINFEIKVISEGPINLWQVVLDKNQIIGEIEQEGKKFKTTNPKDDHHTIANTLDEAVSDILAYYNLHQK